MGEFWEGAWWLFSRILGVIFRGFEGPRRVLEEILGSWGGVIWAIWEGDLGGSWGEVGGPRRVLEGIFGS